MRIKKALPIYMLMMLGLLPIFTASCGNDDADDIDTVTPPPAMQPPAAPEGMVLIPAGEFQMGSNAPEAQDDEQPVHTVYVDAFYMDKHEVTNAQYKQFVDANPQWGKDGFDRNLSGNAYLDKWIGNTYPTGTEDHPVVFVSWYAAVAYSKWSGKRLPTEAEWEYAARGGLSGKKYPWGAAAPDGTQCNFADASVDVDWSDKSVNDGYTLTAPVGSYPANGYGLYDMAGNAYEWCLDEYDSDFYARSPRANPIAGGTITSIMNEVTNVIKKQRVRRGGSWFDVPEQLRVAARFRHTASSSYSINGFRCVRAQ